MKISEFVLGRNLEKQAVYRYISRHEELLSKCSKDGKELEMPAEVVEELEKQYPLEKPVLIVNGKDPEEYEKALKDAKDALEEKARAMEMLALAREKMFEMQEKISEQKQLLTEKEYGMVLLEEKNNQEKQRMEQLMQVQEQENRKLEEEVAQLKMELEVEKQKTWFQKLIGR